MLARRLPPSGGSPPPDDPVQGEPRESDPVENLKRSYHMSLYHIRQHQRNIWTRPQASAPGIRSTARAADSTGRLRFRGARLGCRARGSGEENRDALCGVLMLREVGAPVVVEREGGRVVAEALLDDFGRDSCLAEERGVRMAEVV